MEHKKKACVDAQAFFTWEGDLLCLAVAAKNVDDLVHIEFLHLVACRTEVLAGIEFARFLVEYLADCCGHCKTAVGVDVDLADSALGSLAELLFGDTYCIGKFAAMSVDDVDIFLRNGAGSVEYDGEAGELLLDFVENVECEGRRYQTAGLGIAGALLGFELVCAVAGADGDCEGIAAGAGCEVDNLFGTGVVGFLCGNLILYACEDAEFGLDCHIVLVCIFNNLLGEGDVLFVRKGRCIDHHGTEAHIDATLAELETVAMIEMENDLGMLPAEFLCIFYRAFCHVAEEGLVGIVARTLGNLEDNRALGLSRGLDNGLELLHVVEVECGDGVTAFDSLCEHLAGVHKAKIFVIYHSYKVIDRFLTKSSANLVIFADTLYYLLQEMSHRILFIHGLASSGRYKMADQLRILVKGAEVLAPDVPPEPDKALTFLQSLCLEYRPDLIVGHSLGGFWAQKLRGWRKALVNPTFHIAEFLRELPSEMKYLSPREDGAVSFFITEEMCRGYEMLEETEYDGLDQKEKDLTIAFFADSDETVRQGPEFALRYGKPGISYPGKHQPVFPEMKQYIVPAIKEFCGWQ